MEGVFEVRRIGERKNRWRGKFAGEPREWHSDITVWIPGRRIAWRATSAGAHRSWAVCVEPADAGGTRLTLKMLIDPGEAWAQMPSAEGISRRLQGNLARFKALVEATS
ncbi:MAG: SRPBCC family protein [Chthoniobacteraceae bacterium]